MIRFYYVLKLIARGLRLRPLGSLLTLVACWFALCQLTVVIYAVDAADRISAMPAASATMIVYLKDSLADAQRAQLEKTLNSMGSVSKVLYVPRDQGLARMRQWLGDKSPLVEGVDPRILPDAFELTIKREYAGKVASIAGSINKLSGVDDIRCRKGLIGFVAGSFREILIGASVLGGVVLICLALLIFLSIRVGIVSRKQEIEVMGMLGANYLFVYAPYLIEAALYGLLGSVLAIATTSMGITYLQANFPMIQGLLGPPDAFLSSGLLIFACVCSMAGALLAIKRSIDA